MTALAAYEAGLAGAACWVSTGTSRGPLPLARWTARADRRDRRIVAEALRELPDHDPSRRDGHRVVGGRVLDLGCGPGRITEAVLGAAAARGLPVTVLGVDLSATAVGLARARGVPAVQADVLAEEPLGDLVGGDRWDRVLLADGNLGIGGDPVRLLRRVRSVLAPGGRVVADVRAGGGVVRTTALIEADEGPATVRGELPWAWVGAAAAEPLGLQAGLALVGLHRGTDHRPVAVWEAR